MEQMLENVKEVFVEFPKRLKDNRRLLEKMRLEEQDLLHAIEIIAFSGVSGFKLAKQLQTLRQERRKLKNEVELLEPIVEMTKQKKVNEHSLSESIGKTREIKRTQCVRGYRMRVRRDLQEAIDKRRITT